MFIGTSELRETEMHHVTKLDKVDVQTDKDDWKEMLKINNQTLTVLIDTGADCNVIFQGRIGCIETE